MPRNRLFILIIYGAIVLLLFTNPIRQAILPSFEGLNAGVEGANLKGVFYRIDQNLPSPYTWISQDPKNTILQGESGLLIKDKCQVRIEVNNPQTLFEPFVQGKTVHYWVKESESKFIEVEGQVNVYSMGLSVSAVNLPGIDCLFQSEQLWLALTSVTWNKALQKQGAAFGQAWEAPLAVIIGKYEVLDKGDHFKVDPSEQGRWLTLYSSTQQLGTISDLGIQVGGDINATFTGDLTPDSRLKQTAFFPITLTDFGVTTRDLGLGISSSAPVVHYTLKIYSVQLGKYTYTNPDSTPFGVREPESQDVVSDLTDPFRQWLSNPLNILGLAGFTSILFFGVVAIVLFWFFGRPRGL